MSTLTFDAAKKAEGQTFAMNVDGMTTLDLVLSQVEERDAPDGYPADLQKPFSMIFTGAHASPCEQRTYVLESPGLGRQEIFLVPIGEDVSAGTVTYQALFS